MWDQQIRTNRLWLFPQASDVPNAAPIYGRTSLALPILLLGILLGTGCASNRFQLANASGTRNANIPQYRVPANPIPLEDAYSAADTTQPFTEMGTNLVAPLPVAQANPAIARTSVDPYALPTVNSGQAPFTPPDLAVSPNTTAAVLADTRPMYGGVNNQPALRQPQPLAPVGTSLEPAAFSPILAGRVIDNAGRAVPTASIEVYQIQPATALLAVSATSSSGVFQIRGVQPQVQYEVVAIFTEGGQRWTGSAVARAPNTNIVIPLIRSNQSNQMIGRSETVRPQPAAVVPQQQQQQPQLRPNWPTTQLAASTAPPTRLPTLLPIPANEPVVAPRANSPNRMAAYPENSSEPTAIQLAKGDAIAVGRTPVYTLNGERQALQGVFKKYTLLIFTASWCSACQRQWSTYENWWRTYATAKTDLNIIAVACENGSVPQACLQAQQMQQQRQLQMPIYVLPLQLEIELRQQLNLRRFPTYVLLDANGQVIWQGAGNSAAVSELLEKL